VTAREGISKLRGGVQRNGWEGSRHAPGACNVTARSRQLLDTPAPGAPAETRRERHVRLLTDVRDRLRGTIAGRNGRSTVILCRLHNMPWNSCASCSKPRIR